MISNIKVEYNGEHVYPNKEKLTEEEQNNWKEVWNGRSANEKYTYDQIKLDVLIKSGFKALEIWDSKYL